MITPTSTFIFIHFLDFTPIFFTRVTRNFFYYQQFKYCLVILSAEESASLKKQYKLLKNDSHSICCLVSPYNPKEVNAGWRFSFENGRGLWKKGTRASVATNASLLPVVKVSKIGSGDNAFVFEPFIDFIFAGMRGMPPFLAFFKSTSCRVVPFEAYYKAYSTQESSKIGFPPFVIEPISSIPANITYGNPESTTYGLRSAPWIREDGAEILYSTKPNAFVGNLPGIVSRVTNLDVTLSDIYTNPTTKPKIVWRRDSVNRLRPQTMNLLFNEESSKFPRSPGAAPRVVRLSGNDFVDVLLPVTTSLHESVFVDSWLYSMWDKCPEHFVTRLDELLKRCVFFFIRRIVDRKHRDFAATQEFASLFSQEILSLNFPILALLGVLREDHTFFFIKKVGYATIPQGRSALADASPYSEFQFVKKEVEFFVDYLSDHMPWEHKKGCPFVEERRKIITAVSCRIVFSLHYCFNLHLLP